MTRHGSFRPRLRLMWPAGLQTGDLGWDEKAQLYTVTEETQALRRRSWARPARRTCLVMPYQEEPRDVPARFVVTFRSDAMRVAAACRS